MSQALVAKKPFGWSPQQIQVLKNTIAKGCSDDELQLFEAVCGDLQLSPFRRQIYAIKRQNSLTIQIGIDGFRAVAARSGELEAEDVWLYAGEDLQWVEAWPHRNPPMFAKVTIWKKGSERPISAIAKFMSYYVESNPLWKKMPEVMLGKCAACLAYRKAFPQDFAGIYGEEEMMQADAPASPQIVPRKRVTLPEPQLAPPPASTRFDQNNVTHKQVLTEAMTALKFDPIFRTAHRRQILETLHGNIDCNIDDLLEFLQHYQTANNS